MFIKNLMFLLLTGIFISGCCKGSVTREDVYVNNTNHFIVVVPFSKGLAVNYKSRALSANQTGRLGFIDSLIVDSVHIVYDNTYSRTHYNWKNPAYNSNSKAVQYDSIRNFFTDKVVTVRNIGKCSSNSIHTYTFTEQDYLDAQK